MKNLGGIVNILFIILNVVLALKYQFPMMEWLMMIAIIVILTGLFRKIDIKGHVFLYFLILYITCSVQIVALFELHSPGFFKNTIYPDEYRKLALWGNHLYFVLALSYIIFNNIIKPKRNRNVSLINDNKQKNFDRIFCVIALIVIFLQFLTIVLGLTDTTEGVKTQLPFHLNGIIDEIRGQVFRYIFAIYLFHKYQTNTPFDKNNLLLFVLYSLLEVFVCSSKAVLVECYLQAVVLIAMIGKFNKSVLVKVVVPLLLALVVMYPVIEMARSEGNLSLSNTATAFKNRNQIDDEEKSSTYIRTFLTGVYYTKLIDVVSQDNFTFDFRQLPQVIVLGGGSAYMTRVIDQMPESVHHSSGITGLCDALLWGGHPMCYIYMFILMLIAVYGDNGRLMRDKPLYRLILFFWFYTRILGTAFSYFIDPLFFAGIGSIIIKLVITKMYYAYAGKK